MVQFWKRQNVLSLQVAYNIANFLPYSIPHFHTKESVDWKQCNGLRFSPPINPPSRAVAYNIAKMQSSKIDVALLPVYTFFGVKVWNGIWKKILAWNEIWSGRLLVWNANGMDEICQYGIWKNCLPFHSMPYPVDNTSQIK